jgi:integrase
MAKQKRSANNEPRVAVRGRTYEIRLTCGGREIRKTTGLITSPENERKARGIAAQMQSDMYSDDPARRCRFDPTHLERYMPWYQAEVEAAKNRSTVEHFQDYIEALRSDGLDESTLKNRYESMLNHLKRWGQDIKTHDDALAFFTHLEDTRHAGPQLIRGQKDGTRNRSRSLLTQFCVWSIKQGRMDANPFCELPSLKAKGERAETRAKRKPFTMDEVKKILKAANDDPQGMVYAPFIYALFSLGLRPSEAVGLRWKDLDSIKGTVTISSVLLWKGGAWVRQVPKTETSNRVIQNVGHVVQALEAKKPKGAKPSDPVFTTPEGQPIKYGNNFRKRYWARILEAAGLPYRPPYTARHTTLSQMVHDGVPYPQVAQVAGHIDTKMVISTYVHSLDHPQLPVYALDVSWT